MRQPKQGLLTAATYLVCAAVAFKSELAFKGTEFGGGTLARNQDLACNLFLLALLLSFRFRRAASVCALVASCLSLPLYVYLVFPRPFRLLFGGNWKAMELPREIFVWDGWWVTGIPATMLVVAISVVHLARSLNQNARTQTDRRPIPERSRP